MPLDQDYPAERDLVVTVVVAGAEGYIRPGWRLYLSLNLPRPPVHEY